MSRRYVIVPLLTFLSFLYDMGVQMVQEESCNAIVRKLKAEILMLALKANPGCLSMFAQTLLLYVRSKSNESIEIRSGCPDRNTVGIHDVDEIDGCRLQNSKCCVLKLYLTWLQSKQMRRLECLRQMTMS